MLNLKGKNRIEECREIATQIVSEISCLKGVSGIVFEGGLTRGFMDNYSDIDITVFLAKKDEAIVKKIKEIASQAEKHRGIDVDLAVHQVDELKRKWSETERWDYSHARIVLDIDDDIRRLFEKKLRVSTEFWVKRIVIYSVMQSWYCCPQREGDYTIAEMWIERGDLISAHYCVNYGINLMLKTLFALNREFWPPEKWMIFQSYHLKWIPEGYCRLLEEAIKLGSMSEDELTRRLRVLRKIWKGTVPKIEEETGLTLKKMSEYYVRKVLRQS